MQRIFLDANILLEILFTRQRAEQVLEVLSNEKNPQFCVSVLSVDLVMYFVELEKKDKSIAWEFLQRYEILDMSPIDNRWAYDNDAGDYEDALQTACALRNRCAKLITLDRAFEKMFGSYIIVATVK